MPRAAIALSLMMTASVPALSQDPGGLLGQSSRRRSADTLRRQAGNPSDRYLVVMKDSATGMRGPLSRAREVAAALASDHRVARVDRVLSNALNGFVARLATGEAEALSRDPRVEYVEQDVEIGSEAVQTVPAAHSNWGLDRIDQSVLPSDGAYQYDTDGSGVNAYVVDSGIRVTHSEFGGRAVLGPDFVTDDPGNPHPDTSLDCHSNIGPEVDLYAPGVAITSAYFTGDYAAAECSGTSMAAPQVAGVVARFLQLYWWAPPGHVTNQVVYQNATAGVVYDAGAYTPNRLLYSGFMDQ